MKARVDETDIPVRWSTPNLCYVPLTSLPNTTVKEIGTRVFHDLGGMGSSIPRFNSVHFPRLQPHAIPYRRALNWSTRYEGQERRVQGIQFVCGGGS